MRKTQKQLSLRFGQELGPRNEESRLADNFGDKLNQRGSLAGAFIGVTQARLISVQFVGGTLMKMVPAEQSPLKLGVAPEMATYPLTQVVCRRGQLRFPTN